MDEARVHMAAASRGYAGQVAASRVTGDDGPEMAAVGEVFLGVLSSIVPEPDAVQS